MKVRTSPSPRARITATILAGALLVAACTKAAGTPALTVASTTLNPGWWTVMVIPTDVPDHPIQLPGALFFASESTALTPSSKPDIQMVAGRLLTDQKDRPTVSLIYTIAGHTAATNTPDANITFSKKRAMSVRDQLVADVDTASAIQIVGCGQDYPIGTNGTPTGDAQNRRVAITESTTELSRDQACK
jgi:outer membrane protein OmpA-like peptidoglycan-associated protein